jgi:hypothetical protein
MKTFTNLRINKHLPLLIWILIFPLTVFLTGCYTTKTEMVTEEEMLKKKDYEILSVVLKNDKYINLKDLDAKFYKAYRNEQNVIMYLTSKDTIIHNRYYSSSEDKENLIKTKDIKLAKIAKSKYDPGMTAFVIIGSAIIAFSIIMSLSEINWAGDW